MSPALRALPIAAVVAATLLAGAPAHAGPRPTTYSGTKVSVHAFLRLVDQGGACPVGARVSVSEIVDGSLQSSISKVLKVAPATRFGVAGCQVDNTVHLLFPPARGAVIRVTVSRGPLVTVRQVALKR